LVTVQLTLKAFYIPAVDILNDGSIDAYFPFENSLLDLVSLTSGGGNAVYLDGLFGKSLSSFGCNFNNYPCKLNDFTYSFYIRLCDTHSVRRFMQSFNGHTNYGLILNDGSKIKLAHIGSGLSYLQTNNITLDLEKHLITYTKSSVTGARLYYDLNLLVDAPNQIGNLSHTNGANCFMGHNLLNTDFVNGDLLEEVRIFDRAITADEVAIIYNLGV
jgi:hypothetical protein